MLRKTTRLKQMLLSPELEFLMEAHNGLSAKVAEEAGFKGIWASGLSISAALGVRDNNEASWTQVLEVVEFMSDATTIPILLDGDTGYGNFNSMRRLVKKLEQRGIAGVCIEDKLFPKTNSFIRGTEQPLADIAEFCGKISAGKDAQTDDDFVIIARVEAFIAGWGLEEALRRAEAYRQAGADGILIHSALRKPDEILAFKKEWGNRAPVVIVPTKYYTTPTSVFRDYGFSIVIWANHLMRSALSAMQETAATIYRDQNLLAVEDRIASVSEVFRIQGADELEEAEKRYLPVTSTPAAIILAASRGEELGELTLNVPKAMVLVGGKPVIQHIIDTYRAVGVKEFTVVRGYKKEAFNLLNVSYADNDDYATTQELASLAKAIDKIEGDVIISYGDVLFKKYVAQELVDSTADLVIVVDYDWQTSRNSARYADYVSCSEPQSTKAFYHQVFLTDINAQLPPEKRHGEWAGMLRASPRGAEILRRELQALQQRSDFNRLHMSDFLRILLDKGHEIRVIYTSRAGWLDIDSIDDILAGSEF
ncbi:MAG: phosphoenolpyruvate mutase [Turneriella sp.]|nr:phosphoenolpyruvate mutase [Turneriella sp.]